MIRIGISLKFCSFVVLGIFGGIYGALVINLNLKVAAFRKRYLKSHAVNEVAILAAITALISFTNMFLRLDMGELLSVVLQECKASNWGHICDIDSSSQIIRSLAIATILRTVGTIIAYGCKIPCGIFVPSMAIGATFGRMLGIIVQAIHRQADLKRKQMAYLNFMLIHFKTTVATNGL